MLFALQKLVGALLAPLTLALLLIAVGALLRWRRRGRTGLAFILTGAALAFLGSVRPVAEGLLIPLESSYVAIGNAASLSELPRHVVVLGSGYRPRAELPVTAALDSAGVVRLAEGVRLFRQLPGAMLVVSGGKSGSSPSIAQGYAQAARALGVPAASIITLDDPLDTAQEVREIRKRLGSVPILLVTSASHMPRAMKLCARGGVNAIAAPTGHLARGDSWWRLSAWLPSGREALKVELALHEYLGRLALIVGVQ